MDNIPNSSEENVEIVEYEGEKYVRINPDDIDLNEMTLVQKVTDVVAFRVTSGRVRVITMKGGDVETKNYAEVGDYIVYNIGVSDESSLSDKMLDCDKKVIKANDFNKLYSSSGSKVELSSDALSAIIDDLKEDNSDNSDFSDYNFVEDAEQHEYIGRAIFVARVPFNFVISAPWGKEQYIKAGGYITFNPNTSIEGAKDIYGTEGAHDREAGQLEKTYKLADDQRKGVISDTFKMVLKADKSPIAGIQFNMVDLAKAYERAGKEISDMLEKYLH